MAMTTAQIKVLLFSLLPPGFSDWFDFSKGSFGNNILEGAAEQLKARVSDAVDAVELDANPATLTHVGLAAWEVALGIAGSTTALFGTDAARKAAIIAALRALARNNIPGLRAILGPLLGYADPSQLQILEVNRSTLSDYLKVSPFPSSGGPYSFVGGGTLTATVGVADDPAVSDAGARLLFENFSASDIADVMVILTGPDSFSKTWSGSGFFTGLYADVMLYAKEFFGRQIYGAWTVEVSSVAGDVSFDDCFLDVEAVGRNIAHGEDGHGSEIFHWGPFVEIAKAGVASPENRAAALTAIARYKPAHTFGTLVLQQITGSSDYAIPDDLNCIPDMCIPA